MSEPFAIETFDVELFDRILARGLSSGMDANSKALKTPTKLIVQTPAEALKWFMRQPVIRTKPIPSGSRKGNR